MFYFPPRTARCRSVIRGEYLTRGTEWPESASERAGGRTDRWTESADAEIVRTMSLAAVRRDVMMRRELNASDHPDTQSETMPLRRISQHSTMAAPKRYVRIFYSRHSNTKLSSVRPSKHTSEASRLYCILLISFRDFCRLQPGLEKTCFRKKFF